VNYCHRQEYGDECGSNMSYIQTDPFQLAADEARGKSDQVDTTTKILERQEVSRLRKQ
jgi:hypothetical protein